MCNTQKGRRSQRFARRGSILILSAILMVFMMALLAFAIDLGYMYTVRTQLQRSADASAIAGAWELLAEEARLTNGDLSGAVIGAREYAEEYAGRNQVGKASPSLGDSDVVVGYRQDIFDRSEPLSLLDSNQSNTVYVRVRRSADQNGVVPLFFAPVLGFDHTSIEAEASAALMTSIKGFRIPPGCENLPILPFALDKETWDKLRPGAPGYGSLPDDWTCAGPTGHESERLQTGGQLVSAGNRVARQSRHGRYRQPEQQHGRYFPADPDGHQCRGPGLPQWRTAA